MKHIFILLTAALLIGTQACHKPCPWYPNPGPGNPNTDWTNKKEALRQHNTGKVTIQVGITGTLNMQEGNCMPMIDYSNTTCKNYPITRTIEIYPYTLEHEVTRDSDNLITIGKTPIATTVADREGFYEITVPDGKYSILIQEKGKLYANTSDGWSGICPVTVANNICTQHLEIDYASH